MDPFAPADFRCNTRAPLVFRRNTAGVPERFSLGQLIENLFLAPRGFPGNCICEIVAIQLTGCAQM